METPGSGACLKDDIASIWNKPSYHDVTIVCADGVELGACRAVLAARCTVFDAMFYGSMQESLSQRVTLSEIKSAELNVVLGFIYTESIDTWTDLSNAVSVYRAANFFLLPNLQKMALDRMEAVCDLEITAQLVNEAAVTLPWNELSQNLYDMLFEPFCAHPLALGDLNGLSDEALELLLRYTKNRVFHTSEYDLLLCVVDWAWCKYGDGSTLDDHPATLDATQRILPKDEPAGLSLLRMMPYLDLTLICPHKLKEVTEAVDALTGDGSPAYMAILYHACETFKCPRGHPSRYRGIPYFAWDRKDLPSGAVLSEDDKVVEYLQKGARRLNTAQVSVTELRPTGPHGVYEWDIIFEKMGSLGDKTYAGLGVARAMEKCVFQSLGDQSYVSRSTNPDKMTIYGTALQDGDVVSVYIDLVNCTCAFLINGEDYGNAWEDIYADYVYVLLCPGARYRIRTHEPMANP